MGEVCCGKVRSRHKALCRPQADRLHIADYLPAADRPNARRIHMTDSTSYSPSSFRDPSVGDLIIRTSDDVDFHVDRRRLADASPVFSDMFSLPNAPLTEEGEPEKALVRVSEPSSTWEKLLPICYLTEADESSMVSELLQLWEVGRKYHIAGVVSRMRGLLYSAFHLDDKPFVVYALACALDMPSVARVAAKRTLQYPVFPDTPEFAAISARALYQLLDYRRRCGEAAGAVFTTGPAKVFSSWCLPVGLMSAGDIGESLTT